MILYLIRFFLINTYLKWKLKKPLIIIIVFLSEFHNFEIYLLNKVKFADIILHYIAVIFIKLLVEFTYNL